MHVKVKSATVVQDNPKVAFSFATTPRIAPLYP